MPKNRAEQTNVYNISTAKGKQAAEAKKAVLESKYDNVRTIYASPDRIQFFAWNDSRF